MEKSRASRVRNRNHTSRAFSSNRTSVSDRETEHVGGSDENQLAGERPVTRYSIYAGRYTVTDYFDQNNYTHDPRMQFMAWGVMYNGAWDYPADTRGYTWGIVQEFHTKSWAFRYGIAAEPKYANGSQFDRRLFRDHGQTYEVERRYSIRKHDGAVRLLGYSNRDQGGSYAEALKIAASTERHARRRSHAARRGLESMEPESASIRPSPMIFGFFTRLG